MPDISYSAACMAVAEAFVAAYPGFVSDRLDAIAPELDVAEAVRQGREWLTGELKSWATLPADRQHQGPLQIFQTAMALPTAALEAAGVSSVTRDVGAARALPGDAYALAPASSREIGQAAWRAHVAWGIAKAAEVADMVPRAESGDVAALAIVTMKPADRASVQLLAAERGVGVHAWRNPGAIAAGLESGVPRWALVDLDHAAAEEAVRQLAAAGAKVAAYGPEPDDIAMARWMALGAATVIPRQKLVAALESWLPRQA